MDFRQTFVIGASGFGVKGQGHGIQSSTLLPSEAF